MSRLLFLNLPVADLAAGRELLRQARLRVQREVLRRGGRLHGRLRAGLRDAAAARPLRRLRHQAGRRPTEATALTACVTAADRAEVDSLAEAALSAGATPAKEPQDYGFMYQRSFHDLDGHLWEIAWMDPVAVEKGPAEFAGDAT